ncbi:MAG: TIGR04086 family membrane protein [Bacillota bacterium]|nr:TIGR04086 family membrane protein [Bacillota bacterium]
MGEVRSPAAGGDRDSQPMAPAVLWSVVVALAATALGALILALGLLLFDELRPTPGALLAVSLAAVAVGALWGSRRVGHGGLWVGGATGLGYGLVTWALAGIFQLGSLNLLGVVQALVAAAVVGAVAGVIGVNL